MARLAELVLAADPTAWADAGFTIDGGACVVGGVRLRFVAADDDVDEDVVARGIAPSLAGSGDGGGAGGGGVRGWGMTALANGPPDDVEGLATWEVPEPPELAGADAHPLEVVRIDHVVVLTPDLDRTVAAIEAGLGVPLRRQRDGPSGSGAPAQQAFFRLGEVVLELVRGPADGVARFWGLAFEVASLDRALDRLGPERLREPKPAVQPGRRIASVRDAAGLGLPVALMDTPRS